MGGWAQLLEFLAGEDVNGDQMNLCVSVLASLGGRHVDNLAGTVLDDDETVLSQGRALHGEGGRCASVCGGIESVLLMLLEENKLVDDLLPVPDFACVRFFSSSCHCRTASGGQTHMSLHLTSAFSPFPPPLPFFISAVER